MFDRKTKSARSFLQELRSNTAGNTLAMAGMALFPMAAMIGGGVDVSRIYLVQTRLQQACDAGALAGRRQMGGGSWIANSNAANTAANNMFKANFDTDAYGSYEGTSAFTENAGTVTGVATVKLDMAVMQMFGYGTKSISVECDASMSIPNTDVMFVLDTTGSMNCPDTGSTYCSNNGNREASNARIRGLRSAVKCFYETLAKRNSDEDCGSTPSAGSANTAHLRFGFVPYSTNVNVGKLLPNDFIADEWEYQTREAKTKLENVVVDYAAGEAYIYQTKYTVAWGDLDTFREYSNIKNKNSCKDLIPNSPPDSMSGNEGSPDNIDSWVSGNNRITSWTTDELGTRLEYDYEFSNRSKSCKILQRTGVLTATREYRRVDSPVYEQQQVFDRWEYKAHDLNVSPLKNGGSSWNNSLDLPLGNQGLDTIIRWDGCIEERKTVITNNFDPIPSGAYDLDIDLVPNTSDPDTQWGPLLENAVWGRYTGTRTSDRTMNPVLTASELNRNFSYTCTNEASKLRRWDNPDDFDDYLDNLDAIGSTYHDIGLIWGARLLSPTGIFASENAATSTGGAIDRHLIFMTDGDTVTDSGQYTSYGVEWYNRRRTSSTSSGDIETQVNKRFLAMCGAIKNKNITLWVVSFGNGVSSSAITNLENCATSGKFYNASNSAELLENFRSIANDISQLRLTN